MKFLHLFFWGAHLLLCCRTGVYFQFNAYIVRHDVPLE